MVGDKPTGPNSQVIAKDISESGLAFRSKTAYALGTILHAEVHLPGRAIPVSTRLRTVRVEAVVGKELFTIGATFESMPDEERTYVKTLVEGLDLYRILAEARKLEASDIHLTVGRPPLFRTHGRIQSNEGRLIQDGEIRAMLFPLLNEAQIEYFETKHELDFAFSPSVDSRYRVNLHVQKGFLEAAIRAIPVHSRSFRKLGLPGDVLERFCREKAGLFLIAGKTGSGKTTTLTTMIDFINENLEKVIITIEDPVEYIHSSKKSVIKQREIGNDTISYAEALRHTLRQDPDVIVVSELLDGESLVSAIRAAETGHLVIATIHAPDTAQTLDRVLNMFPPEHFDSICNQMASCLLGIMFQMLVPSTKNDLVVATELLVNTSAVRAVIRDRKFSQLVSYIETGKNVGMHTLQSSLWALEASGQIEPATIQASLKLG
jgi:twitching motility protein PilT